MSKKQPEQLETATTHNGKDHTRLVEKVHDAKHDPVPVKSAKAARKTATGQTK
jgi:hypothetical protein